MVTVIVAPTEGPVAFPPEGKRVNATAFAKANETDPNTSNNEVTETTTILPDGNQRPTVTINTPVPGALFVGPANISITATAADNDGTVSSVDFYADNTLIGAGTLGAPGEYSIFWNNVSLGAHNLVALVTDNLGKAAISDPITIFVNGIATVNITSPANLAKFDRSANIGVTANATIAGGTITKVEFYRNGFLLGPGTLTAPNQYSFTWNTALSGNHVLTAVATDNTGAITISSPITVIVNEGPVVSLSAPVANTVFSPAPASFTIVASASDWDGYISRVDFYANNALIGTDSSHGVNQFNVTWSNIPSGTYSLTAVAIDNLGTSSTSTPVIVRVKCATNGKPHQSGEWGAVYFADEHSDDGDGYGQRWHCSRR